MKTKNLITSGIALIVVILIVVFANQIANKKPSDKALKFFPEFSVEKCSAFQIADSKDTVKVKRKGDIWIVVEPNEKEAMQKSSNSPLIDEMDSADVGKEESSGLAHQITEYPADSAAVQSALEKFEKMKKDEVISQNPEKQELFEVDEGNGVLVEVWNDKGNSIGKFRIGKKGTDWSSHYVRPVGSNTVYSVRGSIKYSFFTEVKRWRDKSIVEFNKDRLKTITLTKQGSELVLEKEIDTASNAIWNIVTPDGKVKAKKAEVDKIVNEFATFRCAAWEEDPSLTAEDMGFDEPEIVITAKLDNGDVKKAIIGNQKDETSRFWVTTPDRDYVYLVNENIIKRFDEAKFEDLKEEETEEVAEKEA
ncbi:MAG: DUF4340 domain-containing protein [Chitinivibrionales bacterium]|nr:DUF4340 domain-containing protein [Chitinivibrionales bacterium]